MLSTVRRIIKDAVGIETARVMPPVTLSSPEKETNYAIH